jgi:tetratricopeptide (TPR) repeat protein
MFSCPACGAEGAPGRERCPCGADLSLLATLDALPGIWFNRGLAALERGAPGEALEWLSACCAARPNDAEARLAQAKVWARLGHLAEARAALERAEALDATALGLAPLHAFLEESDGSAAAPVETAKPAARKPRAGRKKKSTRSAAPSDRTDTGRARHE